MCCWDQGDDWHQRIVAWPDGVCRDGVLLRREAVGELIADLIFDCDCPGAELVLCLPLEAASWCVVDGYGADGSPGLLPQVLQSVDLPFDLAESYVTSSPVQEALAVVGVPRSLIQGWSEVAELADVPLRRVDWSLTAAQRALDQLTQAWDGDLAWLVMEEKSLRLLLFRQGVPEVDHALEERDPLACPCDQWRREQQCEQQHSGWHRQWANLVMSLRCNGSPDGRRPAPWRQPASGCGRVGLSAIALARCKCLSGSMDAPLPPFDGGFPS